MQVYLLTDTWFSITLPYMFIMVDFKALHTIYFKDVLMQSPRKDKRMQDFHQAASISRLSTTTRTNCSVKLFISWMLIFWQTQNPQECQAVIIGLVGFPCLYSFLESGQPAWKNDINWIWWPWDVSKLYNATLKCRETGKHSTEITFFFHDY